MLNTDEGLIVKRPREIGMKRLVILAAALAAVAMPAQAADYAMPAQAADYAWPVVRVIDGDTIVVDASADLPAELADLRVRLRGVDAPEKGHRAACDAEREAADRVTAMVAKVLDAAETIVVRDPEWGKWGGRVVADVILDGEHSLPELLATFGHASRDGSLLAELGWCGRDHISTAGAWEECTAAPAWPATTGRSRRARRRRPRPPRSMPGSRSSALSSSRASPSPIASARPAPGR